MKNDPNAAKILLKLRRMNMALILGNQVVNRIVDKDVRESFIGTAIKFVNATPASANELAEVMNCVTESGRIDASFLIGRPALNFAFHIQGQMPRPIAVQIPAGVLENQPHMTPAEFVQVREDIRSRYYIPRQQQRPAPPPSTPDLKQSTKPTEPVTEDHDINRSGSEGGTQSSSNGRSEGSTDWR